MHNILKGHMCVTLSYEISNQSKCIGWFVTIPNTMHQLRNSFLMQNILSQILKKTNKKTKNKNNFMLIQIFTSLTKIG